MNRRMDPVFSLPLSKRSLVTGLRNVIKMQCWGAGIRRTAVIAGIAGIAGIARLCVTVGCGFITC